jgi:hypothetical protein
MDDKEEFKYSNEGHNKFNMINNKIIDDFGVKINNK